MTSAQSIPDVTVVIAAYNAEAPVRRAVDSALAQIDVAVEVIVVDDCSTDGTAAICQSIADVDPRLRVIVQPRNAGPAAARNTALANSRAAWLTALDSDDFMEPRRLSTLLAIAREEEADFVADDLFKQDEGDTAGARRWRLWSDAPIGRQHLDATDFVRGNLTSRHGGRRELGFVKPLMSRAFLTRHALTYPDLRLGEDYVLYAEALILGARFVLTDPAGYVAVVRETSLSGAHPTEVHEEMIAQDRRLMALPGVAPATRAALTRHVREVQKEWMWRRMIDAVRESDPVGAVRCFWAPPEVGLDLAGKLGGEALRRTRHKLTRTQHG
ncbi:succinoglycan biosynthesis protein ExoU [Tranquillimonas rosea]|uniref:Succinoglycan biosynthesis protein ExoU n=1 Tax=Tranquillimonas rosea TaxID=641238 RepID=A0A1H9WUD7_9RHOB|nr:glycosyltransferase family 2 protein [Tranquillimonas rosea]SES36993.1 succinoglycan biosynthesis protein ExoU [Tranquillimonas rosea]